MAMREGSRAPSQHLVPKVEWDSCFQGFSPYLVQPQASTVGRDENNISRRVESIYLRYWSHISRIDLVAQAQHQPAHRGEAMSRR